MASITESLMGLGSWELSADWDPSLYDELTKHRHVEIYQGETHLFTGPILERQGDEDGISVGGPSMLWYLGTEDKGPILQDQRFGSGRNKFSNPLFNQPMDAPEVGQFFWKTPEGTKWTYIPFGLNAAAHVVGHPVEDDVLSSEESWPARGGDVYTVRAGVWRVDPGVGRIRLRTIYEGRFSPPGLLYNGHFDVLPRATGWLDLSVNQQDAEIMLDPPNAGYGDYVLRMGPTTPYTPVLNWSFEDALNHWNPTGVWGTTPQEFVGPSGHSAWTSGPGGGPSPKVLLHDSDPNVVGSTPIPVSEGERWRAEGHIKSGQSANGEAEVALIVPLIGHPTVRPYWMSLGRMRPDNPEEDDWRYFPYEFSINGDWLCLMPCCVVYGHSLGEWFFDNIALTRLKGNVAKVVGTLFPVTPERPYTWRASVRSNETTVEGSIKLTAACKGAGRPDVVLDSQPMGDTDNGYREFLFNVTPPSGYDSIQPFVTGTDIIGGPIWVDSMSVRDDDRSTVVVDLVTDASADLGTVLEGTSTAPAGTESVRVEIIAESMSDGWIVIAPSIVRQATATTAQNIVGQLLSGLSVLPGSIPGSDVIQSDWDIENMTHRAVLHHLCREGMWPGAKREYRLNPDRTLDVGGALFEDRTDVVLADRRDQELLLLDSPQVEESAAEVVTDVVVLGDERESPTGRKFRIRGSAHRDLDAVDYEGRPLVRTHIIEDAVADHKALADAIASYELELLDHPSQSIRIGLSDHRAYFERIVAGDSIYVYKPEAGLEDTSNEQVVDGKTVFPQRTRVWEQTINMGPGYRAMLRREDGSTMEIPVNWEESTSVELEVGDRPEWERIDPRIARRAG